VVVTDPVATKDEAGRLVRASHWVAAMPVAEDASTATLARLVTAYVARRPGWGGRRAAPLTVLDASVLVEGRPGVLDVVADVDGHRVHVALGLRPLGDEARFFPGVEDPVLGLYEDGRGLAVAFDATADEGTATALLEAVAGVPANTSWARRQLRGEGSVGVVFDDRVGLLVFDELSERSCRWTTLVEALDDAGFPHLPAPVAFWRRRQYDLGMVRELLPGVTSGQAMALASLRDLLAADCEPGEAKGDFAAEAERLGTMTARLHLALDRSFGRRPGDVTTWSAAVAAVVRAQAPHLAERDDVRRVLDDLVALTAPCVAICSHGDLHLNRVGYTDEGWYLVDVGFDDSQTWIGEPAGTWRSPLADVADMLWSFGHMAAAAVAERLPAADLDAAGAVARGDARGAREPAGSSSLAGASAQWRQEYRALRHRVGAWERRNRRAYIGGYLAVPGIAGLVPPARHALRTVTSAFELEQSVRRSAGISGRYPTD